jgi:hypothetical protein
MESQERTPGRVPEEYARQYWEWMDRELDEWEPGPDPLDDTEM